LRPGGRLTLDVDLTPVRFWGKHAGVCDEAQPPERSRGARLSGGGLKRKGVLKATSCVTAVPALVSDSRTRDEKGPPRIERETEFVV